VYTFTKLHDRRIPKVGVGVRVGVGPVEFQLYTAVTCRQNIQTATSVVASIMKHAAPDQLAFMPPCLCVCVCVCVASYSAAFTHNASAFLPRDAKLARHMLSPCMCLCVWVTVTRQYCVKTVKPRIMKTTPHDSSGTLVF